MVQHENPAFIGDDDNLKKFSELNEDTTTSNSSQENHTNEIPVKSITKNKEILKRDLWGKDIEFLLSCIAMSVGLGNVWRFPFTALENGGGAFLIPYLIVLFLVGKPFYYLEMIIGQFSSRGAAKVYDLCPALRGIGIGQLLAVFSLGTYYSSIMSLICNYLIDSFKSPLPWSYCKSDWKNCINSTNYHLKLFLETNSSTNISMENNITLLTAFNESLRIISSSEFYFQKDVLHEVDNINDGIGLPNWQLVIGLLVSWILIYVIIIRGVKSSGKASYFLAIFPYVVLGILFIRAITLPGSLHGMMYFIRPQWDQLLNPKIWYAAVTQVFFSLSVCFGNIIMYASYNKFNHNVYKDATIVTLLDTFTSLLAGFTIFGILGHLAHEIGTDDVGSVVKGGTGLAFISYPDAIAKFEWLPQAFSVLFFGMLFTLGIGSNIAMTSCTMTAIRDNFPNIKTWSCALGISIVSFCIGLVYITPGGQFILNLVDYFGASLICLILGIAELLCISWIYGVDRICKDTEFMIGKAPGLYWRICWAVVTPLIMISILIYTFVSYKPLTYNDIGYPDWAYAIGWTITAVNLMQVPIWACYAIIKQPGNTVWEKIAGAFKPKTDWGPTDPVTFEKYKKLIATEDEKIFKQTGFFNSIKQNIFG